MASNHEILLVELIYACSTLSVKKARGCSMHVFLVSIYLKQTKINHP
jgi:hypothetical protein